MIPIAEDYLSSVLGFLNAASKLVLTDFPPPFVSKFQKKINSDSLDTPCVHIITVLIQWYAHSEGFWHIVKYVAEADLECSSKIKQNKEVALFSQQIMLLLSETFELLVKLVLSVSFLGKSEGHFRKWADTSFPPSFLYRMCSVVKGEAFRTVPWLFLGSQLFITKANSKYVGKCGSSHPGQICWIGFSWQRLFRAKLTKHAAAGDSLLFDGLRHSPRSWKLHQIWLCDVAE